MKFYKAPSCISGRTAYYKLCDDGTLFYLTTLREWTPCIPESGYNDVYAYILKGKQYEEVPESEVMLEML